MGKDAFNRPYRLFFAYGSNMNSKQMQDRCQNSQSFATAYLPNHQLDFFDYSKAWDSGRENVTPCPGENLWGVIYKLSFFEAESLDTWQDVRMDGAGTYFHFPAIVFDTEKKRHHVLLYKKNMHHESQLPSQEYLDFIIQGAQEHHLPLSYIHKLKSIPSRKATYSVPHWSKFNQSLLLQTACECGDLRKSKGGPGFKPQTESTFSSDFLSR